MDGVIRYMLTKFPSGPRLVLVLVLVLEVCLDHRERFIRGPPS